MPHMKLLCICAVLIVGLVQLSNCAATKTILEVTGDTIFGHEFLPPAENNRGECDTSNSTRARFLHVPFTAKEEAVHLVEALFAPEFAPLARIYVYTGEFKPENSCYNVNLTRTLDAGKSFRIAMMLEKGEHFFVITGMERGNTKKGAEGPFSLRVGVADFGGIAYEQHQTLQWSPPLITRHEYNCSHVGNRTAYLGHEFRADETAAHDIGAWLTGQPGPDVRSTVYVFDGTLNPNAPFACQATAFHDAHESVGHFNEFPTIFKKGENYTIVVVFDFDTKPTAEMLYGIQVARSDRYTTNTSYAPYDVVEDVYSLPDNCTESGVVNKYQYIPFTTRDGLTLFDFYETFDGNHTVLSVYSGHVGGSTTTPPSTCTGWLGSMRDDTNVPTRHRSLFLRLDSGQNYTVIVASQEPGVVGAFRPAIFSGVSINPTPPPATTTATATTGHTTTTGHDTTAAVTTTTTGHDHRTTTEATATTATTGATTGGHPSHHGLQGWQVALIVVGTLAGVGIVVGGLAYYLLVVRKRPQYELIN